MIAQKKPPDALNTTQNPQLSAMYRSSIKLEKPPKNGIFFIKKLTILAVFLDLFWNGTLQRAGVF